MKKLDFKAALDAHCSKVSTTESLGFTANEYEYKKIRIVLVESNVINQVQVLVQFSDDNDYHLINNRYLIEFNKANYCINVLDLKTFQDIRLEADTKYIHCGGDIEKSFDNLQSLLTLAIFEGEKLKVEQVDGCNYYCGFINLAA